MSEFNFKSQPYTTIEQSQRLIALGLKVETADCCHWYCISCVDEPIEGENIPAWSLHRLWELANIKYIILDSEDEIAALYDEVIMKIEQFIEEGYFNKEYLQEQAGSRREE